MKTKLGIVFFVVGVALAILLLPGAAQAQTSDCTGVDLVFLMDESDSMKNNDRGDLRVNAIRVAVELLGANVLYDCPDVVHRLSVIGFGDAGGGAPDTEFYVKSAEISPNLNDFSAWEAARDGINSQLPQPTANRGATDYRSAFEAALGQLEEWRATTPDGGTRLRGVVVLADGGPCVYDLGCSTQGNSMNTQAYLDDLEAFLNPNGNEFPWRGGDNPESVRIWLVAFNATDVGPAYNYMNPENSYGQVVRGAWEHITTGHGGSLIVLRSDGPNDPDVNRDVSSAIADITDAISGSVFDAIPCPDPFYIDPYLDQISVRILKIGSDPDVPLEDVSVNLAYAGPLAAATFGRGQATGEAGDVNYYQADGPNEFYVIGNPSPGMWKLEVVGAECRDLDVASRKYDFQGRLLSPAADAVMAQFDEGDFYDPAEPVHFQFELLHQFGADEVGTGELAGLTSLPEFPISAIVTIERPDGATQTLTLNQRADGVWESEEPIRTPAAGRYHWRLEVKTLNGQQTESVVRFQDTGSFDVKPVNRFHIEIVEPAAEAQAALNRVDGGKVEINPLRVVAQLIDDVTGQPLTAEQATAAGADGAVLSALVGVNGRLSQAVAMSYDSAARGWVASLRAGEHGIPLVPGEHTVTAALNRAAYNRERYRPALENGNAASVTTTRNLVLGGALVSPDAGTPTPEYDEGEFFDPEAPVHLVYRLYGWGGDPTPALELAQYPLRIEAVVDDGSGGQQKLALTPAEGDLWRSVEPLRLPHPGEFTWVITATVPGPEYAGLITPIRQTGKFAVSEVERFHVRIVEPEAGKSYPLNHYADGKQWPQPLPIRVEVVDDATGAKLTPQELGAAAAAGLLSATVEMDGAVSAPAPLAYDAAAGAWAVELADTTAGMPLETGRHTVRVALDRAGYDATRYRLSSQVESEDEIAFERIKVQPVVLGAQDLAVEQPAHRGSLGCVDATALPVAVAFYAANSNAGTERLHPDVLTGNHGAALARAFLVDAESEARLQEGEMSLAETADGALLMATFPMTDTPAGAYTVIVEPNPAALAAGYEFLDANEQVAVAVTRTYNMLYDPLTCGRAATGLMAALAGFVALLGVNFWRRPTGYLEVLDTQNQQYGMGGNVIAERRLGRNPLLLLRPQEVMKLADPEVAKLVIRKGNAEEAFDPNPFADDNAGGGKHKAVRAVRVTVYDQEGNILVEPTLTRGQEPGPISANLELRYS